MLKSLLARETLAIGEAMIDLVVCHSDSQYAERPTAFYWGEQRLEIEEILARWRSPQEQGFRVRTVDRQIFELFYDQANDAWRVEQR